MANIIGFDPVAWSIDGGRHRGELLRVLAYAATTGAEGIVESPDCRVKQLGSAGPQITMDAGAVLIRNRSASVLNQTYVANGRTQTTLDVDPTSGSTRSDLVVVRVKDPQYSPWGSVVGGGDPLTFQYVEPFIIKNVPASTTTAASLNLGYSAVEIARLDIPANTTNITTAMIKDLRKVAQPRRQRRVVVHTPGVLDTTGATNVREQLSNMSSPITCPTWATELKMIVTIAGGRYSGDMNGQVRAEYGYAAGDSPTSLNTQDSGLDSAGNTGTSRITMVAAGELALPASYRGKEHFVRLSAVRTLGTGNFGVNEWTTLVVDMEFVEVAD